MKGVTTLSEKQRLADAANCSDLSDSDSESDEPTVPATALPAQPADFKSPQPLQDFALSLRAFDEYVAFLSPLGYTGTKAEELCFAALSPSFGLQLNTLDAVKLNLFERLHAERSVEIPMDQLCELCFREDEELSSESFAYVLQLTNQNESLGDWVWSYTSVLNVLQLFGCDDIMVPCDTAGIWFLSRGDLESKEASIDVYLSKQAYDKMGILLKLIASSYNRPHPRYSNRIQHKHLSDKIRTVNCNLICVLIQKLDRVFLRRRRKKQQNCL